MNYKISITMYQELTPEGLERIWKDLNEYFAESYPKAGVLIHTEEAKKSDKMAQEYFLHKDDVMEKNVNNGIEVLEKIYGGISK